MASGTVSVIDTATNTVTATVAVGTGPFGAVVTPAGTLVYVANGGDNSVSVIDLKTLKEVTRIPVGQVPKRNITALLP